MCVGSKSALNSIAPHPKETISLQNNLLKNLEINLEINNHNSLIPTISIKVLFCYELHQYCHDFGRSFIKAEEECTFTGYFL